NPITPKTDADTATPNTQTNSTPAKAESEPGGSQPQSNPGPKKSGSAILININKAKQKMTVFVDGIEKYHWPVSTGRAGFSTPSGTYTATSMNEIWYSKEWDNSRITTKPSAKDSSSSIVVGEAAPKWIVSEIMKANPK